MTWRLHLTVLGGSLLDIDLTNGDDEADDDQPLGFGGGSRCESIERADDDYNEAARR